MADYCANDKNQLSNWKQFFELFQRPTGYAGNFRSCSRWTKLLTLKFYINWNCFSATGCFTNWNIEGKVVKFHIQLKFQGQWDFWGYVKKPKPPDRPHHPLSINLFEFESVSNLSSMWFQQGRSKKRKFVCGFLHCVLERLKASLIGRTH